MTFNMHDKRFLIILLSSQVLTEIIINGCTGFYKVREWKHEGNIGPFDGDNSGQGYIEENV